MNSTACVCARERERKQWSAKARVLTERRVRPLARSACGVVDAHRPAHHIAAVQLHCLIRRPNSRMNCKLAMTHQTKPVARVKVEIKSDKTCIEENDTTEKKDNWGCKKRNVTMRGARKDRAGDELSCWPAQSSLLVPLTTSTPLIVASRLPRRCSSTSKRVRALKPR